MPETTQNQYGIESLESLARAIVSSIKVSLDGFGLDDLGVHIKTATTIASQWREAKNEIKDLSASEALRLNEALSREIRVQIFNDTN
jgi:hypothetical protein